MLMNLLSLESSASALCGESGFVQPDMSAGRPETSKSLNSPETSKPLRASHWKRTFTPAAQLFTIAMAKPLALGKSE